MKLRYAILAMAVSSTAWLGGASAESNLATESQAMKIQVTSPAFQDGKPIPSKYTCDGEDVSPPLNWTNVPPEAKSLVLISDDPDAPVGTWVHWVLYDLPPTTAGLSEGVPKSSELPNGAKQGINDFRRIGYGGPCPPPGKPHRYYFKLYALDTMLGLKPGATKAEVEKAMKGHILAQGQLMGTYQRK
ncbi:MAG: YbhB/YbcL family Raf kinase inhibitor-like protein [Verrucomicrobiae bacterium]|nr:YbhB/YbcL family Raf kinase inhibitor-like protein [Verrucomicrobiae bacterium]MDW7981180.1 YbhB/YbcL family Raf kinase inhibitor-like protein [Verrucomicrobiales bacterium]